MTKKFLILLTVLIFEGSVWASSEGMSQMPLAQEKRTFTVKPGQDFEDIQGFGAEAPMVRMMNLMMVGGSGYEGMDMSQMNQAPTPHVDEGVENTAPFEIQATMTPNPPTVGKNVLEFSLIDPKTKQPVTHASIQVEVFMRSMDMGTEEPKVEEIQPSRYRVKVPFSMQGPWRVRIRVRQGNKKSVARTPESHLDFDVRSSH